MRGSHLTPPPTPTHPQFLLQSGKFSSSYAMRILFDMFPFENWVVSTRKCEAVILPKVGLASNHVSQVNYLGMPVVLKECLSCVYACFMCTQCDIIRVHI